MRTRTIPLINGVWTNTLTSPWVSPELPRGMYDAVVAIVAEQTLGAPTTATFSPTIEMWHGTVGGNWFENGGGGGTGLYPDASFQTLNATDNPSLLPDGAFPATVNVAGATLAAPVYMSRRVSGGFPWRVKLAWNLAGGTTPKVQFSMQLYIREGFVGGFDRVESSA